MTLEFSIKQVAANLQNHQFRIFCHILCHAVCIPLMLYAEAGRKQYRQVNQRQTKPIYFDGNYANEIVKILGMR